MKWSRKNMLKTFIISLLLFGISIVLINLVFYVFIKERSQYPIGKDTYTYFGNGRFEVVRSEVKTLFDHIGYLKTERIQRTLVYDIEKYSQQNDLLYVVGYYSDGRIDLTSSSKKYWAYDAYTGQELEFGSIEEVPRFTILNIRTGIVKLYQKLEDIPEGDRKIFKEPVDFWCLWFRTCYQKDS